ncbi:hypothetical protein [Sphaerisporangium sp. NPDC051011]|uniref:hypothetical protein n=1 Tax=Sphaerisporangium sp. NPDC051011 TaxID=3155792 RepID=UPI0033FF7BBD
MSFDWPAFTVSVLALGVSGFALRQNRKAREVAEASEKSAAISAAAATKSADEAARLTQIEAARDRVANEASHRQLAPAHPGEIAATLEGEAHNASLFGSITLTGTYRVQAQGVVGETRTAISGLPLLLHAHKPHRFHIEHWPKDRKRPQTTEILFRFWPPIAEIDDTDPWTCPCGRPTGETMNGPGHWEMRVPVKPPVEPFVFFS